MKLPNHNGFTLRQAIKLIEGANGVEVLSIEHDIIDKGTRFRVSLFGNRYYHVYIDYHGGVRFDQID